MTDRDTAGSVVTGYLADQCDQVIDLTAGDLADVDVVHDTRTALRRLRSTLRTFADLFEPAAAADLDREARWLAGLLGDVRDRDVLSDRLADHAEQVSDLSADEVRPVLAELAGQRDLAGAAVADALHSERGAGLLATILVWRNWPPLTEAAAGPVTMIGDRVRRARQRERKRVRRATRARAGDEDLHRARKAAKRHRYALEIQQRAEPSAGSRRRKRKARAKRSRMLQTRLGRHQDAVVAVGLLTASGPADTAVLRGRLAQLERSAADRIRDRLRR